MTIDQVIPSQRPVSIKSKRLDDPTLFINRELSWIEFNARVLAEAGDERVPLYERLKFLAIFSSNLDEFFMVRVAGLQAQLSGEVEEVPADGSTPEQALQAIAKRTHELVDEAYRIWNKVVRPGLRDAGIALLTPDELAPEDRLALDEHFRLDIFPVLTPIVVDPAHPFPHVRNKSINAGFVFNNSTHGMGPTFGVVQVPMTLPRLIRVPLKGTRRAYVALEDLILRQRSMIFPQMKVTGEYAFRVTRNFDIEIDADEAEDLLASLQAELRRRERGHAVRLSVSGQAPLESIRWLCANLGIDPDRDVYYADGPLYVGDMLELVSGDDRRELKDENYAPVYPQPLRDSDDLFETIKERDILLHHPYESFEAVVDFLNQAAEDPAVLAIKQTLYRTGGESPMVRALQRAAESGKQVTAVVELKARFDEASNITWARTLERSGVNVMYGLMGLKTHAKVLLVVRKERLGLRRYVHLATGNYNQQTARLYTDLSIFTANDAFGEDASALFNLLTGYSAPPKWNRLLVAPLGLHEAVLGLIHRETEHARAGKPAFIRAKMNSLVDEDVISALYAAAQAGVQIQLMVRGICCLRPGVKGASENIQVRAVIDRYLEHSRIFHFGNDGQDEVYLASADWMPRNFRRRVEVMWPIDDETLRQRVLEEILGTMWADNCKSWELQADGSYNRVPPDKDGALVRGQVRFMEAARERARESDTVLARQLALASSPAVVAMEAEKLRRKGGKKRKKRKGRLYE
jgi:polyphosphate kinase